MFLKVRTELNVFITTQSSPLEFVFTTFITSENKNHILLLSKTTNESALQL